MPPNTGLVEVSQAEAISNVVMAQMSGMMAAFQAQISDLSMKVNLSSSALTPLASSSVARATMVKPDTVRPTTSTVVIGVAMVKSQRLVGTQFRRSQGFHVQATIHSIGDTARSHRENLVCI